MSVQVCVAPDTPVAYGWGSATRLFLAGTIEMGDSVDWQSIVIDRLKGNDRDVVVFNPRRGDWDSTWDQNIEHDEFRKQVLWEQKWIDHSNIVLVHFEPTSKSPITLMELGQLCKTTDKQVIVSCPEEFYRKGNVEIVCAMHNIPVVNSLEKAIGYVKLILNK